MYDAGHETWLPAALTVPDGKSKQNVTINTLSGLLVYNNLEIGVASSAGIFQGTKKGDSRKGERPVKYFQALYSETF